jgi:hypothetical protein
MSKVKLKFKPSQQMTDDARNCTKISADWIRVLRRGQATPEQVVDTLVNWQATCRECAGAFSRLRGFKRFAKDYGRYLAGAREVHRRLCHSHHRGLAIAATAALL